MNDTARLYDLRKSTTIFLHLLLLHLKHVVIIPEQMKWRKPSREAN